MRSGHLLLRTLHVQDVLERVGADHAKADQARSVLWRSLV
jgi:hypothetical protein